MLAARISTFPLANVPPSAIAYPLAAGGIVAAWSNTGTIAIQPFDGSGMSTGSPVLVAGDGVWGLAASSDAYAVLVSRGDILALSVTSFGGMRLGEHTIMGGVPHDVTGNEWFGPIIRAARLDWNGTEWVTYTTVQRLWPDGIAHYGDALRTFHRDASPSNVYWDWGCSHSIEVRLTHNAQSLGPVCSSDCYPEKGVFFMHTFTVFLDSSGNCAGSVSQKLGGVVAFSDGFFASFISGQGRASQDVGLAKVGNDLSVAPVQWLTNTPADEDALHLARYGSGMIAAWVAGGSGFMVELDATGAPKGASQPGPQAQIQGAGDFFNFSDGDVGWLSGAGLARLRVCR
jgi:hypothetical protein